MTGFRYWSVCDVWMFAYGTGQMAATLIETIAGTVHELATPDMKPKALIAAVREKHPEAKKSDIVRAAFFAVIAPFGRRSG